MGGAVIYQRNVGRTVRERLAIQFQASNATADPSGVFDLYLVSEPFVCPIQQFQIPPRLGMQGSRRNVLPATTNPKIDSRPARCIQPAEPVYHVQPPCPTLRRNRIDVGAHHIRLDLCSR